MRKLTRYALAAVALGSVGASAAYAATFLTAKGKFRTDYIGGLEYNPEGYCSKPMKPFGKPTELSMTLYRSSARNYLDCMKRNAASDMEYAQAKIQDGYDKAVSDFIDEY